MFAMRDKILYINPFSSDMFGKEERVDVANA
jgi:hypothetical protein